MGGAGGGCIGHWLGTALKKPLLDIKYGNQVVILVTCHPMHHCILRTKWEA